MGGTSYRFNPKTLSFEKVERNWKKLLHRGIYFFGGSVVLGILFSAFVFSAFDSVKVKTLQNENQKLLTQYKYLDQKVGNIEKVLDEMQVRDDNIYRVILDSDPIPASVREAGSGGTEKYNLDIYESTKVITATAERIDKLSKQAYIQAKSYDDVLKLAMEKQTELGSTPAIMPVAMTDLSFVSSGWGMRMHPIFKVRKFHWGIDFVAPRGTKIYATADGIVEATNNLGDGHGKHIILNHGFGYKTLYAHLNRFNVTEGQEVRRGEVIGFVGSTGTSTSPHLHYEVHLKGKKVNPINYLFKDLSPTEYQEILASSSRAGVSFD